MHIRDLKNKSRFPPVHRCLESALVEGATECASCCARLSECDETGATLYGDVLVLCCDHHASFQPEGIVAHIFFWKILQLSAWVLASQTIWGDAMSCEDLLRVVRWGTYQEGSNGDAGAYC